MRCYPKHKTIMSATKIAIEIKWKKVFSELDSRVWYQVIYSTKHVILQKYNKFEDFNSQVLVSFEIARGVITY